MTKPSNDAQTWGLFLVLSMIWGSSYLFIKIGLDEGMAPLTLVSLRTILGASFLAIVMWLGKARLPRSRAAWGHMSVVGLTNVVIPYALITWGELSISSGMAGILTAMVPLFSVVMASIALSDEPITLARAGGLIVGFGGVILLASPSVGSAASADGGAPPLAGMVAVGLAALSYAVAAVYTRRRLSGKPIMPDRGGSRAPTPLEISFGQIFVAMIVITTAAFILERPDGGVLGLPQNLSALFALVWLGLLGTGVAFLLYFRIIERWGATRATLITYVMPLVAIVLGFLVLGEVLSPVEIVGAALIIGGVVLVNARVGQRPLFGRTDTA